MDHFGPQNCADPLNSESALRFFLKKLQNERANSHMKILLVIFREKKIILGNLIFLALGHFLLSDWAWSN